MPKKSAKPQPKTKAPKPTPLLPPAPAEHPLKGKPRKTYTNEQKESTLHRMFVNGERKAHLARELGCTPVAIDKWVGKAREEGRLPARSAKPASKPVRHTKPATATNAREPIRVRFKSGATVEIPADWPESKIAVLVRAFE